MTVTADDLREINQQLVALAGRFADGQVPRPEFRQARRQLICDALGLQVPEVPEAHDQLDLPREDDTMPGGQPARPHLMASYGGLPAVAAEDEEDAEAAEQPGSEPAEALGSTDGTASEEPAEAPKVKDSTLQITLLLLLLAFVGLGGLLWFVLR